MWGLEFRVKGLGFRLSGLGFRDTGDLYGILESKLYIHNPYMVYSRPSLPTASKYK